MCLNFFLFFDDSNKKMEVINYVLICLAVIFFVAFLYSLKEHKKIVLSIKYPKDIPGESLQDYILTLYPLMTKEEYPEDYWKTLDFVYALPCYKEMSKDQTLYVPSVTGKRSQLFSLMRDAFIESIEHPWYKISNDGSMTVRGTIIPPQLYDYYGSALCFLSSKKTRIFTGKILGYIINRYLPETPLKSTAYCMTGTAKTELEKLGSNVSKFLIRDGFKDNAWIEVTNCNTQQDDEKTIGNMNVQTEAKYGRFFYYSRGSGMFMNLGKTMAATNKVDMIRVLNGYPNTLEGFKKMVVKYNNIRLSTEPNNRGANYFEKETCAQNRSMDGSNKDSIWCFNDPSHYYEECKNIIDTDKVSENDNCFFSGAKTYFPKIFEDKIPKKYTNDTDKLAWLLYVCVNGDSGMSRIDNYRISSIANLGAGGDDAIRELMKAKCLDSIQLTVQPDVSGGHGFEIITYGLDYEIVGHPCKYQLLSKMNSGKLATIDPVSGTKETCKVVPNPENSSNNIFQCGKISWAQPFTMPTWKDAPYKPQKCQQDSTITCNSQNNNGCPGGSYLGSCDLKYSPSTNVLSGNCKDSKGNNKLNNFVVPPGCRPNNCDGSLKCGPC